MPTIGQALNETFGEIDIYVFDQLLKGRFDSSRRVLDAGCGDGRNLQYLLASGRECFGIDRKAEAIDEIRALAARLAPALPPSNFVTGEIDRLPWPDRSMDAVICSAVLHFAHDGDHFDRMVRELWRVLVPGGVFVARLASTVAGVPSAGFTFVSSPELLLDYTSRLGARLLDPIKTTVVHDQRAMTTWVMRKS